MLPTIQIGSLALNTYWLLQSIAILVSASIAFHRLYQRSGIPPKKIQAGLFWVIVGGLAGGPLLRSLVASLLAYIQAGHWSWVGGSSILGVISGALAAALIYCRRNGYSIGKTLDLGILPIPLAQAIGRLACLAAGCCYGRPTDSFWGLYLPDSHGHWEQRYPTQLLSSGVDLVIFAALLAFERHWRKSGTDRSGPFPGALFLLYLQLFMVKRFLAEFLRGDSMALSGPLSVAQWITLLVFLLASGAYAFRAIRREDDR